jgi:hypothetical protein
VFETRKQEYKLLHNGDPQKKTPSKSKPPKTNDFQRQKSTSSSSTSSNHLPTSDTTSSPKKKSKHNPSRHPAPKHSPQKSSNPSSNSSTSSFDDTDEASNLDVPAAASDSSTGAPASKNNQQLNKQEAENTSEPQPVVTKSPEITKPTNSEPQRSTPKPNTPSENQMLAETEAAAHRAAMATLAKFGSSGGSSSFVNGPPNTSHMFGPRNMLPHLPPVIGDPFSVASFLKPGPGGFNPASPAQGDLQMMKKLMVS